MTAPALLGHCVMVYAAMEKQAQKDEQGNEYWEGALTRLVTDQGLSNPYYTTVTRALKAMDCIRQGRRGGGGMASIWYLMQPPNEELYNEFVDQEKIDRTKQAKVNPDEVRQGLRALSDRLAVAEARIELLEAKSNG